MVKQLKSAIEIHTNNYIHPCTCPESTGMMSQSTYLLLLSVLLLHFHSISSASLLSIVERMNKEINRHLRALTFDNTSLENYPQSLPFVQRIINSNHSDRLKVSAAQLLFLQCSSSQSWNISASC